MYNYGGGGGGAGPLTHPITSIPDVSQWHNSFYIGVLRYAESHKLYFMSLS